MLTRCDGGVRKKSPRFLTQQYSAPILSPSSAKYMSQLHFGISQMLSHSLRSRPSEFVNDRNLWVLDSWLPFPITQISRAP